MNHPARPRKSRWDEKLEEPSRSIKRIKEPEENIDLRDDKRKPASSPEPCARTIGGACRSSDHYYDLKKIGEGQFGIVWKAKARRRETGADELVALKEFKLENEKTEGFPITSIRETITLLKGKHPNVINVREVIFSNQLDKVYIVMDYMDRDLHSLMKDMTRPFKMAEIKLLMQQLLSAVAHLHNNWIIHRDLKTSNLLINKGVLKLGDFGLAREFGSPLRQYTSVVVTLWYRAPELLLQTGKYSTPIDIWSVGCIFGELLRGKPLFRSASEIEQIKVIFEALGSPTEDSWPGYDRVRHAKRFELPRFPPNTLLNKLEDKKILSERGFHLWSKLLAYDPGPLSATEPRRSTQRISAKEALCHEFFKEAPSPVHPSLFPTWPREK